VVRSRAPIAVERRPLRAVARAFAIGAVAGAAGLLGIAIAVLWTA